MEENDLRDLENLFAQVEDPRMKQTKLNNVFYWHAGAREVTPLRVFPTIPPKVWRPDASTLLTGDAHYSTMK